MLQAAGWYRERDHAARLPRFLSAIDSVKGMSVSDKGVPVCSLSTVYCSPFCSLLTRRSPPSAARQALAHACHSTPSLLNFYAQTPHTSTVTHPGAWECSLSSILATKLYADASPVQRSARNIVLPIPIHSLFTTTLKCLKQIITVITSALQSTPA